MSLLDKGSSYGCYVGEDAIKSSGQSSQEDRIPKGEPVILTQNVRVRIGLHSTLFKLIWQQPIIACTSTLPITEKRKMTDTLKSLEKGSRVVGDWADNVDFLVMSEVILTIKVANALAKGVPIVTTNFFEDYLNCTKTKQMLPYPNKYIPKLKESTVNSNEVSLEVNANRQTLFSGKLLAFSSKEQLAKFHVAISYAGGKAIVLDNENPDPSIFEEPANMLVQPENTGNLSKLWLECLQMAESKGLQSVPEIQVGLAIITMNTIIYCNPSAKRQVLVNKGKSGVSSYADSNSHVVLAPETQFGRAQKGITQVSSANASCSAVGSAFISFVLSKMSLLLFMLD